MTPERYLIRDRAYGVWHREKSISRFLDHRQARTLTMADLDSVLFVEYGHSGKLPLALVEVAMDIGQEKPTGVTLGRYPVVSLAAARRKAREEMERRADGIDSKEARREQHRGALLCS
jgi:hypothetical protein